LTKSESKNETAAIAVIRAKAVIEADFVFAFKIAIKIKFTIVKAILPTISVKFKTVAGESGCVISVTKLNVIGTIGTRNMPAKVHHITPLQRPGAGIISKDRVKMIVELSRTARNINMYLPVRSKISPVQAAEQAPNRTKQIAMNAISTVEYCLKG
jgi:hypothetical protein